MNLDMSFSFLDAGPLPALRLRNEQPLVEMDKPHPTTVQTSFLRAAERPAEPAIVSDTWDPLLTAVGFAVRARRSANAAADGCCSHKQ
jgi:hypothetical protein